MYEDIITIVKKQMEAVVENEVLKAVHGVGVNVDKEELTKALQYDRDQYNKGYKDGAKAFGEKLLKKSFRFTNNDYSTVLTDDIITLLEEMVGE